MPLHRAFKEAGFSSRDYTRIGGRDAWMEYIGSNPAYWFIYGEDQDSYIIYIKHISM